MRPRIPAEDWPWLVAACVIGVVWLAAWGLIRLFAHPR
jgi:hypothetical protein